MKNRRVVGSIDRRGTVRLDSGRGTRIERRGAEFEMRTEAGSIVARIGPGQSFHEGLSPERLRDALA